MKTLLLISTLIIGLQAQAIVWPEGTILASQCSTAVETEGDISQVCLASSWVNEKTYEFVEVVNKDGTASTQYYITEKKALPSLLHDTKINKELTLFAVTEGRVQISKVKTVVDVFATDGALDSISGTLPDGTEFKATDFELLLHIEASQK